MNEASEAKIGMESLTSLFKEAEKDPKTLERIIENPLQELESIGMSIEEPFRDAVASNLKSLALIRKAEEGVMIPESATGEEPIKSIVKPWGIVLRCNPEGVRLIKAADGGLATITAAISAVSAMLPEAASKVVAVVSGAIAAYLTGHTTVIDLMDKGKGVYITTTWLHYLVPFNIGTWFPIITPIT